MNAPGGNWLGTLVSFPIRNMVSLPICSDFHLGPFVNFCYKVKVFINLAYFLLIIFIYFNNHGRY